MSAINSETEQEIFRARKCGAGLFGGRLAAIEVVARQNIERAQRLIERHAFPLQADAMVGKLSPAGKQMVEICRAVRHLPETPPPADPLDVLLDGLAMLTTDGRAAAARISRW